MRLKAQEFWHSKTNRDFQAKKEFDQRFEKLRRSYRHQKQQNQAVLQSVIPAASKTFTAARENDLTRREFT